MAIPQFTDGPSKQQHMKQYLSFYNNEGDSNDGENNELGFVEWTVQEQIEIYLATLMSIQEMVELLHLGVNKFKLLQTSDINLLREIVKTINIILHQIPALQPVQQIFQDQIQNIKDQQTTIQHPGQNLYQHREHMTLITQKLFSQNMINQLSQIFMYPYQNMEKENRKQLDEATSIFAEIYGNYFSLQKGDFNSTIISLNSSELLLNGRVKQQVNQAFIQNIMECCLESNLSLSLVNIINKNKSKFQQIILQISQIDDLFFKDHLISRQRENLYSWSWIYVRKDEDKDNPYEQKLLLLTNYGIYIIDVQHGNKCSQCSLGSLCSEKYKVEHIVMLTNMQIDNKQRNYQLLKLVSYSQGFSKQQVKITCSFAVENMFSQKQVMNINMIIIFRTLEKGNQFFKLLTKQIPNKFSTNDTFLSFIYSCLFKQQYFNSLNQKATDNIKRLNLESDYVGTTESKTPQNNFTNIQSPNMTGLNFDTFKPVVKDNDSLQFFVGLETKEQIVSKNKIVTNSVTIFASDSKFRDEIIILKEKPAAMYRQQQNYKQILQDYYFKNHSKSIMSIISPDNINYSAIAQEYANSTDKLYDNVLKCFEISRVNLKCFQEIQFPNINQSLVTIHYKQRELSEDRSKISRTKIIVKDMGDDYVDIETKPRIQLLKNNQVDFKFISEISRQSLKSIVQNSSEQDTAIRDSYSSQTGEDYHIQLKHLMRQQSFETPVSKKQLNKKNSIPQQTRRFSKLKEAITSKVMPKLFKNQNPGSLQHIQEDLSDHDDHFPQAPY